MPKNGENVTEFLRVGTMTQQGNVVFHDRTGYELGRLCIETAERYPEVSTWLEVLTRRGLVVLLYHYAERATRAGMLGYLWLYYASASRKGLTRWQVWEANHADEAEG
jgi:hypothetical protein